MNDLFLLSENITIDFSADQIRKILKEVIEKSGYEVIGDISFSFKQDCTGYGYGGEEYYTTLKGATARVKKNGKAYNPERS